MFTFPEKFKSNFVETKEILVNENQEELLWYPRGKPRANITENEAIELIKQANDRTVDFITTRDAMSNAPVKDIYRIEKVPREKENTKFISKSNLDRLNQMRQLGKAQHITFPQNIYLHEHTLTNGEHKDQIWYHSRNVGVFPVQTIPKCSSNGLQMDDPIFAEPLLPQQVAPLDDFVVDALQIIHDLAPTSMDPNFLMSLLTGSPQSYNGQFTEYIHKNYNLDAATKSKIKKLTVERQKNNELSEFMSVEQLRVVLPAAFYVAPMGAVLHNTQAKVDFMMGRAYRMRPINDDSALTPQGWSINSNLSYEWLHRVKFTDIHIICEYIIGLENRLFELGFNSRHMRINIAKHDVHAAYRIRTISKEDRFLSVFNVDDLGFTIDNRQHFGSRASVTCYHRFAYNITKFESEVNFIRNHYPQLGMPRRKEYDQWKTRPPLSVIKEDFEKQKLNPHGNADPLIGTFLAGFLDDLIMGSINISENPTIPYTPCAKTGIRNPMLKAHVDLMERFNVGTNIKKLLQENGTLLNSFRLVVLLGIAIHLDTFLMFLTEEYIKSTLVYIDLFLQNPTKPQHQKIWSTTSGKINCAMTVYYQLRGCMREMWTTTGILEWKNNVSKHARPSKSILKNLQVVKKILLENKGRSIYNSKQSRAQFTRGLKLSTKYSVHDLIGDASTSFGIGFANIATGKFYSRALTELERELIKDIFILEAICTFLMFMTNRHELANFKLNLWGDNEGLVKSFHKCGTSCRFVDALMRIMMVELARFNIDPVGDREKYEHSWCSTKEQIPFGDALSRNDINLFLNHFKKTFPTINPIQLTNIGPTFSPQIREAEDLLKEALVEHRQYLLAKRNKRAKQRKK